MVQIYAPELLAAMRGLFLRRRQGMGRDRNRKGLGGNTNPSHHRIFKHRIVKNNPSHKPNPSNRKLADC